MFRGYIVLLQMFTTELVIFYTHAAPVILILVNGSPGHPDVYAGSLSYPSPRVILST